MLLLVYINGLVAYHPPIERTKLAPAIIDLLCISISLLGGVLSAKFCIAGIKRVHTHCSFDDTMVITALYVMTPMAYIPLSMVKRGAYNVNIIK